MKICKALAVGIILAVTMLMSPAPPRALAQDQNQPPQDQAQPPQDQAQPPDDQNQPPDDQGQPAEDPPGRAGRLSFSAGSVSLQPGGEGDWSEAVVNRTLATGDNLWADKDSRAEVEIGSTTLRVASETSITLLDLDDHVTQVRLSQGSIILRARHLDDEDHLEIDTPNSAFTIERTGEYRVDVNADGTESDVTVWNGRGEVTGGGASYDVVAGQRASFKGTDQLDHEIGQIPPHDDFDNFAMQRDGREDHAESYNYISPEVSGGADLDDNGSWHYVADYGEVWTPRVAAGWAPYRYGHWVWVAPWGWTWVEDEPWGFAPFHYGRWAFVGASWCWVPGPVVVRPVYAPALVAFVGGGFHAGVEVGWFPLAPREVFVPWYRTSPRYVTNVNVTNTRVNVTEVTNVYNTTIINRTNVTRISYANQRVNAVTAVSHETFVNARSVSRNVVRVDEREIANASVVHRIDARPDRVSVMGAGGPARVRPPVAVVNRPVVAVHTPPMPREPLGRRPAPVNVRTETPRQPQPVGRPPERPGEANVPRPGNARPEPPTRRPEEPSRSEERPAPRAPVERPLVRPAPPVQSRPELQRGEEEKFNRWQQQRPKPQPEPRSERPQSRPQQRPQAKDDKRPQQH